MQKDLFDLQTSNPSQIAQERQSYLQTTQFTLSLDHALIGFVFFLIFLASSYGIGFEMGRNADGKSVSSPTSISIPVVSLRPTENFLSKAAGNSRGSELRVPLKGKGVLQKTRPAGKFQAGAPTGKYTLQMIAYKQRSFAEELVRKLQSHGLNGFIYRSGQYHYVCAEAYDSRQQALSKLNMLKSSKIAPPDAYVRNMPHF